MLVLYHSRVLKQWDFRLRLELLRRLDDHGAEDAGSVVGAFAGAHADGLDGEALGKGGFRAQSGGRGGARGGDELSFHVHRGKRQSGSFGDERRGRGGHGDEAVLAAHRAVPAGQIGHDNAVGRQVVGRHGDGNNVGDGIHGAHLVEVNFPNRYAMSPRLGVGHEAEHAVRDGLGAVGHGGTVDDLRYFRRAAVVVATGGTVGMVVIVGVTMVMVVAVLACAPCPCR